MKFLNVFLILFGIVGVMKYLFVFCMVVASFSAQAQEMRLWDRIITGSIFPDELNFTKEWDSDHWRGQDFQATVNPEAAVMRQSVDTSKSMFARGAEMSPKDFVLSLKKARIIKRVYNPEFGLPWDRHVSDDIVIELDHNFYTLSYADKHVVADLLSRA